MSCDKRLIRLIDNIIKQFIACMGYINYNTVLFHFGYCKFSEVR